MLTRTKSRPISTRLWNRPGTTVMRRVPSQKISTTAIVARNWIRWMRCDRDDTERHVEEDLREELIDRRPVELGRASAAMVGDQGRSLSKQRWLQLRGTGMNRCDDGR